VASQEGHSSMELDRELALLPSSGGLVSTGTECGPGADCW
jgi:hypothetical protein